MSIGPLDAAGAAGLPLAQRKGAEVERTQQEVGAEQRQVYYEGKAEAAGGVGQPDGEDHEAAERDADGRRLWEEQPEAEQDERPASVRRGKDPSHQSGNLLDLLG